LEKFKRKGAEGRRVVREFQAVLIRRNTIQELEKRQQSGSIKIISNKILAVIKSKTHGFY
jgi:hypothetical protein